MATKKKIKKKSTRSKKTAGRKQTAKNKLSQKKKILKKSSKRKSPPSKVVATKKKSASKKVIIAKTASAREAAKGNRARDVYAFPQGASGSRSGEQSGDLQGLSNIEGADSESVDELIEEGNAFEADVVGGVQDAGERDEREVRTREVPEDDVPGEYLDED